MTDLIGTREAVEMINSSGWRSRHGTPMTAERLRVVRTKAGALGGFPAPDAYGKTSGWPLWQRASIQQWIDARAALYGMLSTRQVRAEVLRQLRELGAGISISNRWLQKELRARYGAPLSDGGAYWWPAEAPAVVLRSVRDTQP
jgi:hypothetical protein